jgi:NADPH:quinone reductase-like Zn-dependent oxidoreductase
MKAIGFRKCGGPEVLKCEEIPRPKLAGAAES